MKARYVVYWSTGTNTHHYFETYEEAKKYVTNNNLSQTFIAYVLSYQKTELVELGNKELCSKKL